MINLNLENIKRAAKKYGWIKYYSVMRPVSIGTHPTNGMMDFINYDDRTEIRANDGVIRA